MKRIAGAIIAVCAMPTREAGSRRATATSQGKRVVCTPKLTNHAAWAARYHRNWLSTEGQRPKSASAAWCRWPLVANAVPLWIVGTPAKSVKRPPASSTMTLHGARSHALRSVST